MIAAFCALVCGFGGHAGFAQVASPIPLASPATAPAASASPCPEAPPEDLEAAFAYDLNDPVLLHFVSAFAALPDRRQRSAVAAITAAAASPPVELTAALAHLCPSLDAEYAMTRGLAYAVNQWDVPALSDRKKYIAFAYVLAEAIIAISARNTLPPSIVDSATAPFRDSVDAPASRPTPRSSGQCTDMPARVLHPVQPQYPPLAKRNGVSGTIYVKVRLNEAGDVRSAQLYRSTAGKAPGADDLVRQSIYAAAASTYAPESSHCIATAGEYMFTSQFTQSLR